MEQTLQQSDGNAPLFRHQIEKLADELCRAVKGEFDFTIEANSTDETVQKLAMLVNFVIDAARRSLSAVKEQNAKLTELDKLKSDFLANISHELRTPLTLILSPLQTILDDASSMPAEYKENLQRMQRNAARLYTLVNDLLDFSKLEAGQFVLHEELIDLNKLILQLVDDAQDLATERNLTIKFSEASDMGLMLFDRKMLEKIVMNLMSNALKFTPSGGHIHVALEKHKNTIQLSVSDTGIGIPAAQIQNLFRRFHQIDSSSTRYHQGTGIGLSLVHQFVDLMKGKITVESKEKKGTKFTITLPTHSVSETQTDPLLDKAESSSEKKSISLPFAELVYESATPNSHLPAQKIKGKLPLILIAEDNADMRSYIASLLKNSYEMIAVENGKLALDAVYKYRPQVILSDVMMPLIDGHQLTKKIKADPEIQHIPIILITARAGKEAIVSGLETGADDYLPKPFTPEELKARTDSAFRLYQNYTNIINLNNDLDKAIKELSQSKKTLENSNKKLIEEIEERKNLEIKNSKLNNQLVIAARRAGMADIATSVLHNVGNVLNSVNTSATIIDEKIRKSKISNLDKLVKLLQEHQEDIETFIAKDSQGQHVSGYLSELSETWNQDKNYLLKEISLLTHSVQHIKDIITKQNMISTTLGVNEEIVVSEIIEDALMLNKLSYEQTQIEIIKDFSPIKKVIIDRVKLLQILVNLIKNSIESLLESKVEPKQIRLRIQEQNNTQFMIEINDNGIGILPTDLKKLFSYGFTTKKHGHGFGLHTSALSVQDIGGDLSVESDGTDKGATFTMLLPYQPLQNPKN